MLLDTYAWVEFFKGTNEGKKVKEILKKEKCYTCIVSIAELVEWCSKNNLKEEIKEYFKAITKSSVILNLDEEISLLAGKINHERKKNIEGWGMMDSLILATAISYDIKILTGDTHFKDLPNVEML